MIAVLAVTFVQHLLERLWSLHLCATEFQGWRLHPVTFDSLHQGEIWLETHRP